MYPPILQKAASRRFGDKKPTQEGSVCRRSGFSRPSFDSDYLKKNCLVEAKVGFWLYTVENLSMDPILERFCPLL